jgi:dolichol-phosphate mannosyltransferase
MRKISIVIPVFNEEKNIQSLYNEIVSNNYESIEFEIIFIDDGSTDGSKKLLNKLYEQKLIKLFTHKDNLGQSHSILTGANNAKFDTIITLDGDGQNNPSDIIKLLKIYSSPKNFSLVGGIRIKRQDNIIKIISSKVANTVRSFVLKDDCLDTGCSLKIFSKKVFLHLPFFDGIHRFLPALYKGYGYKTCFIPVDHRLRIHGKSKYGIRNRLFKGIYDLLRVRKIINNRSKKKND